MTDASIPLSRRGFLAGLGATAATVAVSPRLIGEASPAGAAPVTAAPAATPSLDLTDIQGNILGGFNQDFAAFIGVRFPSAAAGRAWLAGIGPHVTTAAETTAFNAALEAAAHTGSAQPALSATWLNVAFTYPGLKALGVTASDLAQFAPEFRAGMIARANTLGDVGQSAPSRWPAPLRQQSHAMIIIGADQKTDNNDAIDFQKQLAAAHGVTVLWVQRGAVRADQPGFEHFGWRDGISQPGVRGYTAVSNPAKPNQGAPGQDLLWPGEFLLGHAGQAGVGNPVSAPGPIAAGGPAWATNGSFLVFRRLRQDVAGFRTFEGLSAKSAGLSPDLFGAKLVGRYKSGAPLEVTGNHALDPGLTNPSLLNDANIDNFRYGGDASGSVVPLACHIRKANPRDESTHDGGLADTLTHRIIRRGIPFGASLPQGTPSSSPLAHPAYPDDRGLFFVCYQSSIARQFEFMQARWVNNPDFPSKGAGQDPITAQNGLPGTFTIQGHPSKHVELMARYVVTTGGDYFFQPAVSALEILAS